MKKLLIAIAAAATAIGTYATTAIGGAQFEKGDTSPYTWTQTGEEEGVFTDGFWAIPADATTTWTAGDCGFLDATKRPAGYDELGRQGYMAIKTTFGNPIAQNTKASGTSMIEGGFYYDGLVKFTACDETPELTAEAYAGAKIGFFPLLDSDEDGADTYLYIWSNGGTNLWKTTKKIDDTKWYRVTIKMIANANRAGTAQPAFVVFVDGSAVDCTAAKVAFTEGNLTPQAKKYWNDGQLFASLDASSTEVTGVLYDGQGAIDEVGFADEAPDFAIDDKFMTVSAGENITEFAVDGQTWTTGADPLDVNITGKDSITISGIKCATGHFVDPDFVVIDAADFEDAISVADKITVKEANVFVDETPFETLADAVAALAGDATITFADDYDASAETITIANTGVTTIDLGGNQIKADITASTALVFTNSVDSKTGDLYDGQLIGDVSIADKVAVEIYGGYFDGEWSSDGDAALAFGGQFSFEVGGFLAAVNPAKGFETKVVIEDELWEVVPEVAVMVPVTLTKTHAEATMKDGEGKPVVEGDVAAGTTIFVEATADENYDTPVITVNGAAYDAANGYTIAKTDEAVAFVVTASATEWTITYLDNGTPVGSDTYTVENRGDKALHADLEKADYTFEGWFKGDVKVTSLAEQTGNLELVAKWTAIPYVAQIGDKKFLTLAEAAADESAAGATIKLLADVDGFATLSTAASTLDLNGKKIGAYAGELKITFTGDDAKTVKGGEFGNYNNKITFTVSKNLTITDMTFHQQVDTVGAGELVVTGSTFKNDLNTAGTEAVSTADTSCSYFSFNLAVGTGFAKSTITGNTFYQARRCCLQLTKLTGPAYVYNNTFDGTKQCLTKDEFNEGRKFGAAQIYGQQAPIYIENNSYSGEWIAEAFTMYNENGAVDAKTGIRKAPAYITDQPVVFNGNTVDATVPYLWFEYFSPDNDGVDVTNIANIVWGDLSGVNAAVDRTQGQYKAQIEANPAEVKVELNLALPTGVTYCKDFAGAYYVEDAVVEFSAIKAGDVVIALPGASLESETLVFKPVEGFKNKFTVEAKPQGPSVIGVGAGGVEPVPGEPGVYVVSGDPSSHNVTIDPASLQKTDRIRVTDSTIGRITGVPADQIEIKLNGVETAIDQKYFVGGDAENGFSLELSDAAKAELVEASDEQKPLVIGDDVAVTIKTVAGLKYQLVRGTEVGSITEALGDPVLGNGQALTLEDANKPEGKAFYVIKTSK